MKRPIVIILCMLAFLKIDAQEKIKSPGLMLGYDSILIIREYARYNNLSTDEYWLKQSSPGKLIYYCKSSKDKNKENVAHIYDFDAQGVNIKYTTVTTQEKIKYAVDYFNSLALRRKNVYNFVGVIAENQAVWESNDLETEFTDCNCGNLKVTVISNLEKDNEIVNNVGVKPGRSGELLAIVYTPKQ